MVELDPNGVIEDQSLIDRGLVKDAQVCTVGCAKSADAKWVIEQIGETTMTLSDDACANEIVTWGELVTTWKVGDQISEEVFVLLLCAWA